MSIIHKVYQGNAVEIKEEIIRRLNSIAYDRLSEAKKYIAADSEILDEAIKRNPNIQRIGKIQRIRRRIRRNKKGKIIVQKNVRRSSIKGYRLSGNTIKRIPAAARLKKARKLKMAWKTKRRAKIRQTLMKRRISMSRRRSIGLR